MNRREFLQSLLSSAAVVATGLPALSEEITALDVERWYHVAVARTDSNILKVYIDGKLFTFSKNIILPEEKIKLFTEVTSEGPELHVESNFTSEVWMKFKEPGRIAAYGPSSDSSITFSGGRSEES